MIYVVRSVDEKLARTLHWAECQEIIITVMSVCDGVIHRERQRSDTDST